MGYGCNATTATNDTTRSKQQALKRLKLDSQYWLAQLPDVIVQLSVQNIVTGWQDVTHQVAGYGINKNNRCCLIGSGWTPIS